uniref:NAD(P)H-quinone oxidoreductase subunit 3 n=1 Tax=Selaginella hainanensis TaxID=2547368 RepID=A0A482CFU1_9TRAC|nr:NADH-plastoquinone oxidoreductase subunit 3 [Selaginella hainanensis]QBL76100.1 NADH-plastoquinone oxidoreductase subunit 3 [Selaginella hainanensis]
MLSILEYNPLLPSPLTASPAPLAAYPIPGTVAPVSGGPEKFLGYESGMESMGDTRTQFQIRYYMFASVPVAPDVETVSLHPWATSFRESGVSAFTEASTSVAIPIVGSVYARRKGALERSQ